MELVLLLPVLLFFLLGVTDAALYLKTSITAAEALRTALNSEPSITSKYLLPLDLAPGDAFSIEDNRIEFALEALSSAVAQELTDSMGWNIKADADDFLVKVALAEISIDPDSGQYLKHTLHYTPTLDKGLLGSSSMGEDIDLRSYVDSVINPSAAPPNTPDPNRVFPSTFAIPLGGIYSATSPAKTNLRYSGKSFLYFAQVRVKPPCFAAGYSLKIFGRDLIITEEQSRQSRGKTR